MQSGLGWHTSEEEEKKKKGMTIPCIWW